ncbi:hypothetical protein ACFX2G_043860 [Malus domestica]
MDCRPNQDFEDPSPSPTGHELRKRRRAVPRGGVALIIIIVIITADVVVLVVVVVVDNGDLAVKELEHVVEAFGGGVEGDDVVLIFR